MTFIERTKGSWQLVKSSWLVLKLDKELAAMPLFSAIASMLVLLAASVAVFLIGNITVTTSPAAFETDFGGITNWQWTIIGAAVYFLTTLIANYFGAAIIAGATQRFRGQDPTIRSSLQAANAKFRPLLLFSLMMATIGFLLQLLEERVPFAGKVAVWLVGAAWNVANMFAIPAIVLSDKAITPFDATRQSVRTIKKVWGETVVVNLAVGGIAALTILTYGLLSVGVSGAIMAAASSATGTVSLFIALPLIGFTVGSIFALILVFTALTSIVKAAIYHYAITGEAPEHFNRDLLRAAMTPKKARKLFARG